LKRHGVRIRSTDFEDIIMTRKNLIALSILALVGSSATFAQDSASALSRAEGVEGYQREYGIDQRPAVHSGLRIQASGTRAANGADRDADYLRKYGIDLRPAKSAVAREEVLAELQIWRESGLAELERGEAGADVNSALYRQAAAKYAELRAAPEFAERVEQIARQRGKPVAVAGR
jgi:hypothetical protein